MRPPRQLGNTGLTVSAVGLGGVPLSVAETRPDQATAIKVIHHAVDLGVTFIDTADSYGLGEADMGHKRLVLAWLLSKEQHMIVIVGASRTASIKDSARAADLELDASDLAEIDGTAAEAARGGTRRRAARMQPVFRHGPLAPHGQPGGDSAAAFRSRIRSCARARILACASGVPSSMLPNSLSRNMSSSEAHLPVVDAPRLTRPC